jgi:hypothetical protein
MLTCRSRSAAEPRADGGDQRAVQRSSQGAVLFEFRRHRKQIARLLGVREHHRVQLAALERADQFFERPGIRGSDQR